MNAYEYFISLEPLTKWEIGRNCTLPWKLWIW